MPTDVVAELEGHLNATQQPEHCLRPHQRIEMEEEAGRLRKTLDLPDTVTGAGKPHARARYGQVIKMLADQGPRPIEEPLRRDAVSALHKSALEDVIKPAMLSRAEMRRNPSGAVGEFMRRENAPYVQRAIRAWKRARYALDPQTTDDDHALIEKHRPEGLPWNGTSTFMGDAQTPGHIAMTPAAKENWPLGEPTAATAVQQVVARETREQQAKTPKPKRQVSPGVLAALAAGRAARKANIAATKAAEATA